MEYPGEKLVIRLWETIAEKGIGSLFKPWQARREGMASIEVKRAELLALAQAEVEAEKIRRGDATYSMDQRRLISYSTPSGLQELPLAKDATSPSSLRERAENAVTAEYIKREVNVAKSIFYAEDALSNHTGGPPEAKPSDEWLLRWQDGAGQATDEQAQDLWGRILAGEIEDPGKFSMRTMDFLRSLSKEEAALISTAARYKFHGRLFRPNNWDFYESRELSFSALLELQDLGIISAVDSLGLTVTYSSTDDLPLVQILPFNQHLLIATATGPGISLTISHIPFTKLGSCIASLSQHEDDMQYISLVRDEILTQGFEVAAHRIISHKPNFIVEYETKSFDLPSFAST
jgi:hypothetical protein